MTRQDVRLRTGLFGYRKIDVMNCIEHLSALSAVEQRLARETQRGLEANMAQAEQENRALRQELAKKAAAELVAAAQVDGVQTQLDALTRKLSAAQSEIRRYQTRLFACERSMLALRRENAELEARCEQVQQQLETLSVLRRQLEQAEKKPAPPRKSAPAPEKPAAVCTQRPAPKPDAWQPRTRLEHLSVELLEQMKRLMG